MDQNAKKGLQFFSLHAIIYLFRFGGLAQLVRAPASHAGGLGFESLILHQTRRIRTQFSTRKGSDTFFLCLKCCTTCTGQPQLYRATKRQSLRGRSLCLFVFCCRPLCKLTLKNSGFFSLSAPARFDWRFPAALLFIGPAFPARAVGQPGRSPGRRRHGCPVRSDGRRHRRCGCWRRHPGCRA